MYFEKFKGEAMWAYLGAVFAAIYLVWVFGPTWRETNHLLKEIADNLKNLDKNRPQ